MYAPHEAREDTVLFPALHKVVSRSEYDALGEDFEKREHQLFGKEGFEGIVPHVADDPPERLRETIEIVPDEENRFKAVLHKEDGASRISKFASDRTCRPVGSPNCR